MGEVESGPPSPAGVRRVYRVLCGLAACDGEVAPAERRILDRFALPRSGPSRPRAWRLHDLHAPRRHGARPLRASARSRHFADAFDLPGAEAAALEAEGRAAAGATIGAAPAERDLLQQLLVDLVAADGRIGPEERSRALRLGAAVGLPAEQLEARLSARARQVRGQRTGR